ncbi:hypothetical protein [Clostridium sp. Marseille-Q7071]
MIGEEVFIGNFEEEGRKVDIMAKNKENDFSVIIEVKVPKSKERVAWGQIKLYMDTYKNFDEIRLRE